MTVPTRVLIIDDDEDDCVLATDLLHEIFGKEGDGYHARSALGFAQLPTGAAVEVEAIFEIKA